MDWRHQNRVLISSILTEQSFQRPPQVAGLLQFVLRQPRTEAQMLTSCRRWGFASRAQLRKTIEQLKEDGILVVCDVIEPHDSATTVSSAGNLDSLPHGIEPALLDGLEAPEPAGQ
jgi:hypothetical protein